MQQIQTAILLLNVGTPDKPTKQAVRSYLSQFLNDPRVIDLFWLIRKLLVNLIIVPFRTSKSTKLYKQLWTRNGSPLIYHGQNLKNKLQTKLGDNYKVFLSMRYGKPSIAEAIIKIKAEGYKKIIAVPLFPQHAMSTIETCVEEVKKQLKKQESTATLKVIDAFYSHPRFLDVFAAQIKKYHPEKYEHIVFSYHGLPNRHIEKIHPQQKVENCICEQIFPKHGHKCYKAQCYETSRQLAARLNLKKDQYSVTFQSRLSNSWLRPFIGETLNKLQKNGVKKILLAAPSFVADCLETNVELNIEYRQNFETDASKQLKVVESLNSNDDWIKVLEELIGDRSTKNPEQ